MIRVKHLQCDEVFVFSCTEFFFYIVGLCQAGRTPILHISSTLKKDADSNCIGGYDVLIEFRN